MDKCIIVIDNSNVFIEGQKFSAKQKEIMKANPTDKEVCDPSWRIDFSKLLFAVAEGKTILHAVLVGSRPPHNDYVWEAARKSGFEVTVHDRDATGKEKAVDTELVAQATEIICTTTEPAILKLLSGDRDFIPLINLASRRGWETEMWAFSNAFTSYGQMAQTVNRIKPLDAIFGGIGHNEFPWP